MRKFQAAVYRVVEVHSFEVEAEDHNEAVREALRRVKQRLVKPCPVLNDLLALTIDGANIGFGIDVDPGARPRRAT